MIRASLIYLIDRIIRKVEAGATEDALKSLRVARKRVWDMQGVA